MLSTDIKLKNILRSEFWAKLNKRVGPWLFYIGLFLMFFNSNYLWNSDSMPKEVLQFCYYTSQCGRGFLCLRLLLMMTCYPRYVIGCSLIGLASFYILTIGGDYSLVNLVLVLSASRDANIRVILRIFLIALIIHLISARLFYAFGWAEDIMRHRWNLVGHSYGTANPGTLAQKLMLIVLLLLLLFKVKRRAIIWTICILGAISICYLTLRMSETMGLLLIPLIYIILCRHKIPSNWLAVLPLLCLLLSVLLAYWCGSGYGSTTFESRFSIPHLIYNNVGLSFLSQDCGLIENRDAWALGIKPLAFDNIYLRIFLCDGIIMGTGIMVFLSYLLYCIGKIGKPLLTAIAVVFIISGIMEHLPLEVFKNFTLFYCLYDYKGLTTFSLRLISSIAAITGGIILFYLYAPWGFRPSFSYHDGRIDDIAPPQGFERISGKDSLYTAFIRSLPLARSDSALMHFNRTPNDSLQLYTYRVLDFPLLDNYEQCADVCMRLRAEYLYSNRRFFDICFTDTRQKALHYYFGYCRPAFNKFLTTVYSWANTESMKLSMHVRKLADIQPGDVFVYDKYSRPSSRYGHAVFVADVAVNPTTGQKAFLLIQGSTPASDIHVIRNLVNPDISPWFLLDPKYLKKDFSAGIPDSTSCVLDFGCSRYYPDELRHFD